ncbi:MAG: hypothetical protein ACFCU5_02635 [Pleurocapsa sp.]
MINTNWTIFLQPPDGLLRTTNLGNRLLVIGYKKFVNNSINLAAYCLRDLYNLSDRAIWLTTRRDTREN